MKFQAAVFCVYLLNVDAFVVPSFQRQTEVLLTGNGLIVRFSGPNDNDYSITRYSTLKQSKEEMVDLRPTCVNGDMTKTSVPEPPKFNPFDRGVGMNAYQSAKSPEYQFIVQKTTDGEVEVTRRKVMKNLMFGVGGALVAGGGIVYTSTQGGLKLPDLKLSEMKAPEVKMPTLKVQEMSKSIFNATNERSEIKNSKYMTVAQRKKMEKEERLKLEADAKVAAISEAKEQGAAEARAEKEVHEKPAEAEPKAMDETEANVKAEEETHAKAKAETKFEIEEEVKDVAEEGAKDKAEEEAKAEGEVLKAMID